MHPRSPRAQLQGGEHEVRLAFGIVMLAPNCCSQWPNLPSRPSSGSVPLEGYGAYASGPAPTPMTDRCPPLRRGECVRAEKSPVPLRFSAAHSLNDPARRRVVLPARQPPEKCEDEGEPEKVWSIVS